MVYVMIRVRPLLAGVLAWVVGATASVVVGLLALSLIDADLTGSGDPPLVADPFVDTGVTGPPPSPRPTTGPSGATTGPATQRRLNSVGGYVLAQCQGENAYLVYWSPAPGYRVRDVDRGPHDDVRVRFESGDREVEMRVTCAGGEPRAAVETHDEGGHG
jgi:serine/threonine-protein kinase